MSLDTLRRTAELALQIGMRKGRLQIAWQMGEPLAVSIDWYRTAHQILSEVLGQDRFSSHIQTNGTLLSSDWINWFLEDHRLRVSISLDGPQPIHDARRKQRSGAGTHEKAMSAVRSLHAAGVPFSCISVVNEEQLDDPDAFYEFFVGVGPRRLGINIEETDGINRFSSLILPGGRRSRSREARFRRFVHRVSSRVLRSGGFELRELRDIVRLSAQRRIPLGQLTQPWRILTVDWEGNVQTYSPELLNINIPGVGSSLGNVHRDTFASLNSSPHFQALAAQVAAGIELCRQTCSYFPICGGGAPSNKLAENGSMATSETSFCRYSVQAHFEGTVDAILEVASDANCRSYPKETT